MRNLKRALSLTLASVMLLGMMVVGSSAAAGYDDVAETDNVEAIEVLQAIEVMVGDERGFGPERPVNRAEMAVVMGKLLSLDYNYYSATCPFDDVYDWARGWVGACAANKIVSGRGNGVYDPGATVTAVEAASMLMRALGYFKYQNDYADGFEVSTVLQGTKIGIFDGVGSSATEPMTRNQVAQMVLNALQSAVVEPDGNTINLTTPDGTVLTGKVNYVSVTSAKPFARAIGRVGATSIGSTNDGYIVELGERLYDGKLKLNDDYDPFGRPARNWEYDGKNIGVYAKKELIVFEHVGSVSGKDLYDELGAKTIEDYKLTVNLDGVKDPKIVRDEVGYDGDTTSQTDKHNVDYVFAKNDLNRNNKATIGATGTGVKTEVFVDNEADTIDVVIVNTYLARADKDYDAKKEELAVTAYSITKNTASGEYVKVPKKGNETEAFKLAAEDFPAVKDAAKNTAFLLTVAEGEVQSVVPAEVLSGVQISSFKKGDNVVVDGTTYNFDTTAGFETETLRKYTDYQGNAVINLKDLTYNVYLDVYGNLIGVEEVDAVKNYVFISAIDLNDSNLVNGTADARAIFIDGTTDTIRVNVGKSTLNYYKVGDTPGGYNKNSILNTWCTYTVNNSGVYTLKEVVNVAQKGNDDTYIPSDAEDSKNTTGLAQYHEIIADGAPAGSNELTIDKKHITLKGKNGSTGDFARVYGDEETVYLTADLDELTNNAGTWGVIGGVDTVSTGIEGTNLIVWEDSVARRSADDKKTTTVQPGYSTTGDATRVDPTDLDWSKGVYTLYNDDGVIIAAIVVGEDNGASRNLVYVHTGDVDWEAYNGNTTRAAGDGLFTWTRKVISNGEEITLTEVSEGDSSLARMQQYHWYQVKTNANGEVIGAYQLPILKADGVTYEDDGSKLDLAKLDRFKDLALDYENTAVPETGDKKIGEIAYTVQKGGKSVVLYHNAEFINSYLRMSGRTLYVATNDQTGFIVDKDVDYVLQQWNSNKKDTFIETGSGASNLESVIKELNDRYGIFGSDGKWTGKTYKYQISAILENGVASSVVIYDNNNDYVRPGDTGASSVGNISVATADKDKIVGLGKNTKFEILASGNNTLKVEIIAPEWAKDANSDNELTATATLYMDGKAYERDSMTTWTKGDDGKTFTGTNEFSSLGTAIWNLTLDPEAHTFSVVLSDIEWDNVSVKYVYDSVNGTAVPDAALGTIGTSTKVMAADVADTAFKFTYTLASDSARVDDADVDDKYEVVNAEEVGAKTDKKEGDWSTGVAKTFATTGLQADGDDFVYVIIKGTKAATVTPPTPATAHTVRSNTTGDKAIQFFKYAEADAANVPTDAAGAAAVTGWADTVNACEDDIVLVKAKTADVALTAVGDYFSPDDGATSGLTITEIDSSGVFQFTMIDKAITFTGSNMTTDAISVTGVYVSKDGKTINAISSEAMTSANQEKIAGKIIAYINGNQSDYSLNGLKATPVTDARGNMTGIALNDVPVLFDHINADTAANQITVTVNDHPIILDSTAKKVGDAMSLEGITVAGRSGDTAAKLRVLLTRTDNTTAANVGTWALLNATGSAGQDKDTAMVDGDTLDTNGTLGYVKVTMGNVDVTTDAANISLTGTVKPEIATADKTAIEGVSVGTAAAGEVVKVGATFTVTAKGFDAVAENAANKGGKLAAGATQTNVSAITLTNVNQIAAGAAIAATDELHATIALGDISDDVTVNLKATAPTT